MSAHAHATSNNHMGQEWAAAATWAPGQSRVLHSQLASNSCSPSTPAMGPQSLSTPGLAKMRVQWLRVSLPVGGTHLYRARGFSLRHFPHPAFKLYFWVFLGFFFCLFFSFLTWPWENRELFYVRVFVCLFVCCPFGKHFIRPGPQLTRHLLLSLVWGLSTTDLS